MNKRIIAALLALFVALSAGASVLAANDTEEAEAVEAVEETEDADDEGEDADEDEAVEAEEAEEDADEDDLTADIESEADEEEVEKNLSLTLGENRIITNGDSGRELDVAPCVIDGKVMLPFRAVFEALGTIISWDDETKTVFAVKSDSVIVLQIGQSVMYINSDKVELDAPTVIVSDRTLISMDSVFKAFGSNVEYDEAEKTITIK